MNKEGENQNRLDINIKKILIFNKNKNHYKIN